MKTVDELKVFYKEHLLNDLILLENERIKIVRKLMYIGFAVAGVLMVISLLLISKFGFEVPFILFPFITGVVIIVIVYRFTVTGYVMDFKMLIIEKIVRFIDENLTYNRTRHIPKSVFMSSQIFKTEPNRYEGDDYVTGTVGSTKIEFSELDAKYESGSGKNRNVKIIFKGLFFIADFNKHFICQTVVLPDSAQKILGRLGQKLQSFNFNRDQLVKLEDPEFEKNFVVYSNSQIDARYILSTSLMKRIVDFKKKNNKNIHLSFVGSKVYVAISYIKNLFEPRVFQTLLSFEPIQQYFEDLSLAVGIVEDLNLNTRIWTKR